MNELFGLVIVALGFAFPTAILTLAVLEVLRWRRIKRQRSTSRISHRS